MNQFIRADDVAFFDLIQGLNGNCMRFRNETMPRECTPPQADIGFELNARNGKILLYVQEGMTYAGQNADLRSWFSAGVVEFNDVHALVGWLRTVLAPEMSDGSSAAPSPEAPASNAATDSTTEGTAGVRSGRQAQTPPLRSGQSITDTARVTEQIRNDDHPIFLDEDAILRALSERVVGQAESLKVLSSAVSSHVARSNPRRPLTLFAIGPSGVGKTRTGMSLVSVLNGGEGSGRYEFLRLDMCEYREAHRVSQLIGSPQGYVGYGEGAQLTDALARNPQTIVLFDEIEKAHPDILKVLMNAMDAGRLSSAGRGSGGSREIDCRKAIFFFSSNLDSESILRALEQRDGYDDPETVDEICREHLKAAGIPPELVGRIGHFLVFCPLEAEGKAEVTAMQIRETASEYGLDVRYVAPDVVVEVIQAVRARGGGARVYSYQIDRLLGRVFRDAARHRANSPIRILGPAPFRYEVVLGGAPAAGETPAHPAEAEPDIQDSAPLAGGEEPAEESRAPSGARR